MQKVPCMADRDFLVSQSILQSSTPQNHISYAQHRQKAMRQGPRRSTPGNLQLRQNASRYWASETDQKASS